ncbi:3664_t:CDS:10, partial [Acaulospora colombiana]
PPFGSDDDVPTVSVIGISNWRLDNNKSSRALLVQRPLFTENDLVDTTRRMFGHIRDFNNQQPLHIFNLFSYFNSRTSDYYSLVKSIRNMNTKKPNIQLALARNFGGTDQMEDLCCLYFQQVLKPLHKQRFTYIPIPVQDLINANLTEKGARNLMLIGNSNSVVTLQDYKLRQQNIEPIVIIGSQFPDDKDGGEYSYVTLNRIMMCVETGRHLILTDLEIIYGSLYNLFNQNFLTDENFDYEDDDDSSNKNAKRNYTRISLGPHSNPLLYETLQSLIVNQCGKKSESDDDTIIHSCKEALISIAISDGILRAEKSILKIGNAQEVKNWQDVYFRIQQHGSIREFYRTLLDDNNPLNSNLTIINTFSNINTNIKLCLKNVINCQVDKLSTFKSEAVLQNQIKRFYESENDLYILQCDLSTVNAGKLVHEIPKCTKLVDCLRLRTNDWLCAISSDQWQLDIALDEKSSILHSTYSVALEMYLNTLIRKPIAKLLYVLERHHAIMFLFSWDQENDEYDLFTFWKHIFMDKKIVNIDDMIMDPRPNLYIVSGNYFSLKFPFSHYFMKQIDQYKKLYYEELDLMYENPENLDKDANLIPGILIQFLDRFADTIRAAITMLTSDIVQFAGNLYLDDFVIISSSNAGYSQESDAKLLHFLLSLSCEGDVLNDPIRLHMFWWKNSDAIISELELARMCPSIIELYNEDHKKDDNFGSYLIDKVCRIMIEKLIKLGTPNEDKNQVSDDIFNDHKVADDNFNEAANDDEVENDINSEFISDDSNELRNNDDKDKNNIDMKEVKEDSIPLLLQNTPETLVRSPNLNAINSALKRNEVDAPIYALCCDVLQYNFFTSYTFEELVDGFRDAIDILCSGNFEPLQLILAVTLLKKFLNVFWKSLVSIKDAVKEPLKFEDESFDDMDVENIIDMINQAMERPSPFIRSLRLYFLRDLYAKVLSLFEIKCFCGVQYRTFSWLRDFEWSDEENRIGLIPYRYFTHYNEAEEAFTPLLERGQQTQAMNFLNQVSNDESMDLKMSLMVSPGDKSIGAEAIHENEETEVKLGYVYESIESRKDSDFSLRNMTPVSYRILHLFVHVLIAANSQKDCWDFFNNQQDQVIIRNPLDYCKEHIDNDWSILARLLGCNDETLALVFHSILSSMAEGQIITIARLDTVEKRRHWEYEFTQRYVTPKVSNAHGTAAEFKGRVKNVDHTLESEIDETIEVTEEYRLKFHPRIWRRVVETSFEGFRAYCMGYQNFTTEFPFLSLFLKYQSQLSLLKNLTPIVEFARILSSKLNYRLKRADARILTFEQFLKNEAQSTENLKEAFENFIVAWNSVREHITGYESHEFASPMPEMAGSLPLVYALIDLRDESLYICGAIDYLVNLHNNFLQHVLTIEPGCASLRFVEQGQLSNTNAAINQGQYYIETMSLSEARNIHLMGYEWNQLLELLTYSQRDLRLGHGQEIKYDLYKIEAKLAYYLIFNKVHLNKSNEKFWLDLFSYHLELFSSSRTIISEIKKLIPQETVPTEKLGSFVVTTYSPTNIGTNVTLVFENPTKLLSEFEVLLCFLERTLGGNLNTKITDYIDKWMKLVVLKENDRFHRMINGLRLKHVVSLYEFVEEKVADEEIEYLSEKYKAKLTKQLQDEIIDCVDFEQSYGIGGSDIRKLRIPHDAFAIALKRFMFRYLLSEIITEKYNLADYLAGEILIDCWPSFVPDDVIRDKFPKFLLVANIYEAYRYTIKQIQEMNKAESKTRMVRKKRNTRKLKEIF